MLRRLKKLDAVNFFQDTLRLLKRFILKMEIGEILPGCVHSLDLISWRVSDGRAYAILPQ